MADAMYWILTFVLILTLLCLLGYQLILLVDLEFDYINPYDSTSRVNQVILPEFFLQAIFCFINLLAGHWFILLISLPCLYYNANLYIKGQHYADVTEIYNKLNFEKKKRLFKLGMGPYRRSAVNGDLTSWQAANTPFKPKFVDKYLGARMKYAL